MTSDLGVFLSQALRNPKQISAIFPSSSSLAASMVDGIGPETGPVAEFGPGTGRITRLILGRGVAPENLNLFEMNPTFCKILAATFPGITVTNAPAQSIATASDRRYGAVLSGLPLLSMPERIQAEIAKAAFAVLRADGVFVQFTYGLKSPLNPAIVKDLDLQAVSSPVVWGNLPPARVFRYRRRNTGLNAA